MTRPMGVGLAIAVCACAANADIVQFQGWVDGSAEKTGATFSGTVDYTFVSGQMGSLLLSITNDTPPDVGGFLTGIVFNIGGSDPDATATLVSTSDPDFLDTGEENASPFGTFDAGVALGGNWEGGGNPANGIGVGLSGLFGFEVTALDASSLSAIDFIGGGTEIGMVVRFRGLADGGSDKVPNVPAPGAAALFGLACLGGARRRRR